MINMIRTLTVVCVVAIVTVYGTSYDENAYPGKFTCECGKAFKTRESLLQHKAATGHGNSNDEVKNEDHSFHKDSVGSVHTAASHKARMRYISELEKNKISIDKAEKTEAISDYGKIIKQIVDRVRRSKYGKIYSADVRKAGSYKMQTKVRKSDEFDTNIVISVDVDEIQPEGQLHYIYEDKKSIDENRSTPRRMTADRKIKDITSNPIHIPQGRAVVKVKKESVNDLSHLCYKGDLVPYKILLDLHNKVGSAIEDLNLQNVKLADVAHGPALTITIFRKDSFDISVDLVLSLPWQQGSASMYGWPRKGSRKVYDQKKVEHVRKAGVHLVPKGDETWSISFSRAEAALIDNIDVGNECRRVVMRILKYFLDVCKEKSSDGLPSMSSHLVKTQILWSSETRRKPGYWSQGNKDVCLMDTLADMVNSLRSARLLDYFNENVNLLDNKSSHELMSLAECLEDEIDVLQTENVGKLKDEL